MAHYRLVSHGVTDEFLMDAVHAYARYSFRWELKATIESMMHLETHSSIIGSMMHLQHVLTDLYPTTANIYGYPSDDDL